MRPELAAWEACPTFFLLRFRSAIEMLGTLPQADTGLVPLRQNFSLIYQWNYG